MNYSSITALIADWLARDDLSGVIPRFITLAEERMNRALRVRQMEEPLALTAIVDGEITLAADVADVKLLWVDSYTSPLRQSSLEAVIANGSEGMPTMFARTGQKIKLDGTGSVQGVVYKKIPALATAGSNWVSDEAHSAYLFGAMAEAMQYTGGDATPWDARFQAVLSEITGNSQRYTGPLRSVAR